ncbi:PEP/pyruvate-binding domain-containing protein [Deinococcus radiotolerans]|uniref:PEP/pyruvate-binding domain-containing protein n=1 Tax=Deinococcus radiotolerans TaxID=1309407 RepID=UPI00166DC506|nr:PEP/pyruvate-binding domain-containing protein [Deinococcus radiotolerans]
MTSAAPATRSPQTRCPAPLLDAAGTLHAGPEETGAKAWSLARLHHYGFRVPEVLVVPAHVHRDWLDTAPVPSTRPDLLRAWAARAPLPTALVAALQTLAGRGRHWRGGHWAVRSSSPHEDHAAHAFAGQYLTRLNVAAADLPTAVRDVWQSLWTEHAVTARARSGARPDMAVLLTPMVDAVSSGVTFTADPVTGAPDRLSVHAAWGLGEQVVQGHAADTWTFRTDPLTSTLRLISAHVASKTEQVRPQPGGGVQVTGAPPGQADQPALSRPQALNVAQLTRLAALSLDFSRPCDLEWAFDGRDVWLLQARPITTPPLQPIMWTRGNIGEVTPHPLRAVDWSAAQVITPHVLNGALTVARVPAEPDAPRCALRGGYLYLNATGLHRDLRRAFGLTAADVNALIGGPPLAPADEVTPVVRSVQMANLLKLAVRMPGLRLLGRFQATRLIRWSARQAGAALPTGPAALSQALEATFGQLLGRRALFLLQGSGAATWVLRGLLTTLRPGEGPALALDLLQGGRPSVSAAQAHDLARLADLARTDPAARAWLQAAEPDWPPPHPVGRPLRRGLQRFLRRYGHRATLESYSSPPRWRDDPRPVLAHLALLLDRPPLTARPRRPVRAALWWPVAALLAALARQELRDRELGRSAVFSPVGPYRRVLLGAGTQWAAQGVLTRAEDVFDLTLPEVHAALRGERPLRGLRDLTRDRQATLARQQATRPPDLLMEGSVSPAQASPPPAPPGGLPSWSGTCASRGAVTGRACVLRSPADHADLRPGDILIAPSATPAWTPLYLQVRGLVLETGGLLSHGAIVAREFGLPTLINVPGLLNEVQTGDHLHLDATNGTLTRVARTGP